MNAKAEHYDVIVKPIITEKATLTSENNGVVFQVAKDSTKPQIIWKKRTTTVQSNGRQKDGIEVV